MSWPEMMTSATLGAAASMIVVALTVYQGIRYQRWLPKRDVYESLEALKLKAEEAQLEYDVLRENLFNANQTIQQAEERERWIQETQEQVAELENAKREFDDCDRKLVERRAELEDIEVKLSDKTNALRQVTTDLETQQAQLLSPDEVARLKEEQQSLQREEKEVRSRVEALQEEKATLKRTVEGLDGEIEALEKEHDKLRIEVAELREESAGLQTRIDSMRDQLEDLKQAQLQISGGSQEADPSARTELLWEPSVKVGDFGAGRSRDESEEDALREAEGVIKDAGFIYHPRVLKAFHTSLKCSEDAPLLVLAGISGTGKSALPTRYAEAMGMHFLNVAVQPGWDSPADLLGFYNHLEGRFRPTDLTRALLQMDYIKRASEDGKSAWPETSSERVDASDRMLLVLLDEMNLARVEYYFSEFLSRLELRRGINPASRVERGRAELQLDLGSSGDGEAQTLPIFAGENVLFVGTMNEDESTQSLSDKVIDRSNVMRFGRPNRLVTETGRSTGEARSELHLPRATWSRWVNDSPKLTSDESSQVDQWIKAANESLTRIGRPFAHRVAGAMKAYVQQYPGRTAGSLRDAFADQVEFRVLPRLRGLDAHDTEARQAIEEIARMLKQDLEDRALGNALMSALDAAGDQLFHWNGVDRVNEEG